MTWTDMIVLLASVVTIASGAVGAVRYLQARPTTQSAPRWPTRQPSKSPSPRSARPHQGAPAYAVPSQGSILLGAATMLVVPVVVYAVLAVITSTTVITNAQDDSTLSLITFIIGGIGLLAGGFVGGRLAGGVNRALTAMFLAVLATVIGYFLYKNLTHQRVFLSNLLNSDQATYYLRSQILLVIGAVIGGRKPRKR
jgi:small-conductance mechanosensitive channel